MIIKWTLKVVSLILFFSINNYGQTDQTIQENLEVSEITIDELNDMIKNREGRVLLINIWATWCVPCKEEFPDLIKISDKYGKQIELIGISIDYPDEVESKIIPFLNKLKPNFINYVNVENDIERFINNLNPDWSGAIPATFFYDLEGKQFLFYEGKMSFKEIENEALKKIN
ncbi:MAG: TlpA family protein disulfide reductase [Bacteroidetes bacterium]|nr:TlpA family protein disulfide reductase [Bacteroidota bacterium]